MKTRTRKIGWWRRLFGCDEPPVRVVVIRSGLQQQMSVQEMAVALQANKDHPAVLSIVQLLSEQSVNAESMAKMDLRIQDGMSPYYLMAQSYLDDLLADIEDFRNGRVPVKREKMKKRVADEDGE